MPKFQVRVKEVHTQIIEVEADSADDAKVQAGLVLETAINQDGSDLPDKTEYYTTLDRGEWDVWKAE